MQRLVEDGVCPSAALFFLWRTVHTAHASILLSNNIRKNWLWHQAPSYYTCSDGWSFRMDISAMLYHDLPPATLFCFPESVGTILWQITTIVERNKEGKHLIDF